MRTIPAAVQTLLKSRAQAGENAHNHLITLTGAPSTNYASMNDPTTWTDWIIFAGDGKGHGNICETSDGRAVIIYCESGAIKLAYAATIAGILNQTLSFDFAGATTLVSGKEYCSSSINLVDGKLNAALVFLSADPQVRQAEFWQDTDGTGTGMAKVSDITTSLGTGTGDLDYPYSSMQHALTPSLIQKHSGGNLICLLPVVNFIYRRMQAFYSADNGDTWTAGATTNNGAGDLDASSSSASFFFVDSETFWTFWLSSSGAGWMCEWTNSGANYAHRAWDSDWGVYPKDEPWFAGCVNVDGNCFMAAFYNTSIVQFYKYASLDWSATEFVKSENWEVIHQIHSSTLPWPVSPYTLNIAGDTLICQSTNGSEISGAGTGVSWAQSLRVKRIEINRNKGMVSSATVVFDNKGGMYSPDKEVGTDWKNIMFPNNGIKIEQGYGADLITTFTGTIDDVVMTTFPAEISLHCRDYLKRAYDQLITSDGVHTITYNNFTPEAMFTALAGLAGWAAGDIHTEVTGLTIAEKIFTNETYGDAFSWLADLCGFLVWCDEDGDIYFYKDDDDAVPSSDYAFAEGEDIVSLGYTISDRDLYNKIIVIGDGVSYELTYYNTYGILAQKKMIINASEATTEAQCQAIAEQARYLMNSRARICEFAAICNPYLQIGDTLTVTETSTLISELYKITDISTSQSPDGGYIQHITCYHYAAPAES